MSVEFRFNKMIYRQIDGIVMRSPLGLTMANIFVFFSKKICLHILKDSSIMSDIWTTPFV